MFDPSSILLHSSSHFCLAAAPISMQQLAISREFVIGPMDKPSSSTLVFPIALPAHLLVQPVALLPPITVIRYSLLVHPYQFIFILNTHPDLDL